MGNVLIFPAMYPSLVLSASLVGVLLLGTSRRAQSMTASLARLVAAAGLFVGLVLTFRHLGDRWTGELVRWDGVGAAWLILIFLTAIPLALVMDVKSEVAIALSLGAVLGMTLLALANHLFVLFLGFELMSLSTYLLIVLLRRDHATLEATVKYFFSGALAAGLFLFGLSICYAKTGTMAMTPQPFDSVELQLGVTLMICAALFKIGAFPMQFWLPDVYDAAAPELSGFMSTGIKAAGFLLLIRLLPLVPKTAALGPDAWLPWVSVATMTFGNLMALRQQRLQRLLAYSSISHVGYILAGVWAWLRLGAAPAGLSAVYLYLGVYAFMNTGAFLFLKLSGISEYRQLRGFAQEYPGLAGFFAIVILSLASIPPTGGFLAKFFILWDVLRAGSAWLAAVIALNSLIGLGYYFGLIRSMILEDSTEETAAPQGSVTPSCRLVLWISCAGALCLGLVPSLRSLFAIWLG